MKSIRSIIILLGLYFVLTASEDAISSTPTSVPTLEATPLPVVSNPKISPNETELVAAVLTFPE